MRVGGNKLKCNYKRKSGNQGKDKYTLACIARLHLNEKLTSLCQGMTSEITNIENASYIT